MPNILNILFRTGTKKKPPIKKESIKKPIIKKEYIKKPTNKKPLIKKPPIKKINASSAAELEEQYQEYLKRYFGKSYPDRKLNTRSITYENYTWGLGAEHEMQLFHISRESKTEGITTSNIIFDSQESNCLLVHQDIQKKGLEAIKKSHCCKQLDKYGYCYHTHPKIKSLLDKIPKLEKKDSDFLRNVPWEQSGRYIRDCGTIIKRVPTLMPEIITSNHQNRTIESICEELIFMEDKFIELQMKNPFTKQKVKKYGNLQQLPYGAISNIKIPKKYTSHLEEYTFEPEKYKDYLGSYHVTLTLPFKPTTTNERFIATHQNFGNQVQWIEPLLLTAFFSSDPQNCVTKNKVARGSYRIASTGWGNLAGSDLRILSKNKGIGRYSNIYTKWRKGLGIPETKKLDKCEERIQIEEPPSLTQPIGILSSNIRTFGFVNDIDHCIEKYCLGTTRGCECPKVSGYKMKKPYGMEIRIFDHFNSKHLIDLIRILVYVAENSRVSECKGYVYHNKAWINATQKIMKEGWCAIIDINYIKELNNNLDISIKLEKIRAYDLLTELVQQLYEKNKKGLYSKIMLRDTYTNPPKLPKINRFSWEIQFNNKYGLRIVNYVKKNYPKKKKMTLQEFQTKFYQYFDKNKWSNNILDIIYALESKPHNLLTLQIKEGEITSVYVKDN